MLAVNTNAIVLVTLLSAADFTLWKSFQESGRQVLVLNSRFALAFEASGCNCSKQRLFILHTHS